MDISKRCIICPHCRSYRVERTGPASWADGLLKRLYGPACWRDWQRGSYTCCACGHDFVVRNPAKYLKENRPDFKNRCCLCDSEGMMRLLDPEESVHCPGSIVHYHCTACGNDHSIYITADKDMGA
jgi:hypothetical protein